MNQRALTFLRTCICLPHLCAQCRKTRFPQKLEWWCTPMVPSYLWSWLPVLRKKRRWGQSKHWVCVEAHAKRLFVFRGWRGVPSLEVPSQHLWLVSVTAHLSQAATHRTTPHAAHFSISCSFISPRLAASDPHWSPLILHVLFSASWPLSCHFLHLAYSWLTPLSFEVSAYLKLST